VTGFNLDGQFGTWVTEGEQVHQVGPANWWLVGPPARRGDTILGKTYFAPGDGLWALSQFTEPERLGPGDIFGFSGDPTGPFECTQVVAAPMGFVTCGMDSSGDLTLRFSDGTASGTTVAQQWPFMFSGDGIEWHGRRYLSGVRLPGWSPSVLRTDGTAAGTEIYEEGGGGPFELWGRLAWC
jgi:hypothetical protein